MLFRLRHQAGRHKLDSFAAPAAFQGTQEHLASRGPALPDLSQALTGLLPETSGYRAASLPSPPPTYEYQSFALLWCPHRHGYGTTLKGTISNRPFESLDAQPR